ncbi:MAG: M14 family zinc carboxypeptidase [Anaerolineae bacterium]|nr:hypothetical protein [Ardenticatenia bacterium]MBK8539929.1 hypothetical protein [Ardenticatenia bacterium]HQZ69740.1 M14 family zinc carboxypeptidase [Anaerolineae bacterium]
MRQRHTPSLAAVFLLLAAARPAAPVSARPLDPPAPPPASTDVLIDIGDLSREQLGRLMKNAPEVEEPVVNGTERLSLSRSRVAQLADMGLPFAVLGQMPAAPQAWPSCYSEVAQALDWLQTYATAHDHLVEVIDAGDSYCKAEGPCRSPKGDALAGHDILVAKVTAREATSAKKGRFWADGGLHARELPTIELMRAFIQTMVEGYGRDPQITYLLDHRELYVGLAMNPDGREMVELGASAATGRPWEWRKNAHREREACEWPPTTGSHYGVDLNRNHIFKWNAPGHSTDACEQTYRGRSAGSEPETQAYENMLRQIFPDQRGPADDDKAPEDTMGAMINFHNYTSPGTMLYPWSWTEARAPNYEGLSTIAAQYAAPIGYVTKNSLYPVSGDARDWAYGELGIPGYVIELEGDTFLTPCGQLPGIIRSQLPQLQRMLTLSDQPYARVFAPEVAQVRLDVIALQQGDPLLVTARLDGTGVGGMRVDGAEVTVGGPGGPLPGIALPRSDAEPGKGLPLAADDGAFDSLVEEASAELDTTTFQPGRYYVVVRARAVGGRWGNPRAVWLTVDPAPPTETPAPSPTPSPTATATATAAPSATPQGGRLWIPRTERR